MFFSREAVEIILYKKAGLLVSFTLLLLLSACASSSYIQVPAHNMIERRDFSSAAQVFSAQASKSGSNQLLFKLDYASTLLAQSRYREAIDLLLQAEKLAEIKDYTSIGEEVGVLATGESIRGYKGEDFEKVLINVYLALAFAALGDFDGAQVEARKINLLLGRMIREGKRNYQESPFARYFSALLWEEAKEYNSAYIDYKKTFELDPHFPEVAQDLLGMASRLGFRDDLKKWQDVFPSQGPRRLQSHQGELAVFFEAGLSPIKKPRSNDASLPQYFRRAASVHHGRVRAGGRSLGRTQTVLDIEATSIAYLDDRIQRLQAARVGGLIAKGAIAYGIAKATDNQDLGVLSFIALAASDQADLRSWRSLPREIQMLRIPLDAGTHSVDIEVVNDSARPLYYLAPKTVHIEAGKKSILHFR